jgi:aspartate racemase
MLTALVSGATLIIRTDDMLTSIPVFLRKLEEWRITAMSLPTALWHELVNEMDALPDALRYVVIGGEKARAAHLARWQQLTKVPLWNAYGPTEATIAVTMAEITKADTTQDVPLGKPVKGVSLHLLDENLDPVGDGETGELYFGGVQVARGYLNRPELTAERFIPNPHNRDERLYKSGDLARFRPDGELEFLGRVDDQIKLRGFRIELGEIESILDQVSSGAVVLAREDEAGELRLVAYVVSEKSQEDIQAHLKDRLPAYMLPSAYVEMDRLPVTAGGKIDKRSLPEPDWGQRIGASEYIAPRNDIEERLAVIWADALTMPAIGVTDDFFDNGGHSLLAIRIFARVEKEFGKSLPLATLFRAPTIEQFAKILSSDPDAGSGSFHPAVVPIQPGGTRPAFFCVGGGVINLKNIARQLGYDQPFHALQWQGLTDVQMLEGTLPEIAATFIEAMKSVQPTGPYHLGGSFTAGMVAVEMARQLQLQGEEVALLVGFDAIVERYASPTADPDINREKKRRSILAKVFRLIGRGPRFIWENHLTNPVYREKFQHVVWKLALKFYIAVNRPLPTWMRTGMGEEFFILRVTEKHRPEEKFKGDFELYLTPRNYRKYSTLHQFGWNAWIAGDVRGHQTPGEPCTIMLEPNVERLAGQFRRCIQNTMAEAGAGA